MKRLIPLLLLAACTSSTQVTNVFRDTTAPPMKFQRVAAIAIVEDPAIRRAAEDEMVRQLGTKGVASYTILAAEDERSADAVAAKLNSLGIDGAVTMKLLSLRDEPFDPKGNIGDSQKAFTGYYGHRQGGVSDWESVARVETQIFSVARNQRLWSASTKTFKPKEATDIVAGVSKAVAAELRKSNLID